MSRSLSAGALAAIHAAQSSNGFLYLLTISHASLVTPLRYVRNNVNAVSRGNTFTAFPFDVALADDRPDQAPEVQLLLDNVTREPMATLRVLTTPPTVLIEVVSIDALDTVEISSPNLRLRNVRADAREVTGTLSFEDLLEEPYPGYTFNPVDFPAAF